MTNGQSDQLRVLIADDHAMILEMLDMYLAAVPDITLKTVPNLPAALDAIAAEGPFDLILVDLDMPGMDGLSGLRKAIEQNAGQPVGILTSNPSAQVVEEAMTLGAAGIVLKTAPLKNLANELRFMAGGGRYLSMELIDLRKKHQESAQTALSKREAEVLTLLAEGMPNREIGAALNLAEPTVKMHVKSICTKLGVNNRTQAVITARDRELI
ncbi:response regulator transcription factor [Paracoccus sp. TK19116]|uniref:Response regulator transcription factor n=1 Tax=Paracoccus albicereus TaxID=2922394 RepID=A0ABT1MZG2_9RHOB|nr:response regulator transcription factor [Paracoccus albicereus]MCQ0972256.1 response regulator transcription factor [Paracoccus albicereus]